MKRNISADPEVNKANYFKKKTTEQLEKDLKIYLAMDSGYLANETKKELKKRQDSKKQ